jgi:hypothetical protein
VIRQSDIAVIRPGAVRSFIKTPFVDFGRLTNAGLRPGLVGRWSV